MSYKVNNNAFTVDLTNCDKEPIHIPGLIQPHGILLALTAPELIIVQVSNNLSDFIDFQPQDLLEKPLQELLSSEDVEKIKKCLDEDFECVNPLKLSLQYTEKLHRFNGIVHRYDRTVILELEPIQGNQKVDFLSFHRSIEAHLMKIEKTKNLSELCHLIVKEVRELTQFDRVMVYRFDPDGAGKVIAESKREDLTPYLGLYYPASDIPKQAKELYTLNRLRIIPNVNYQPVPLIPPENRLTGKPLDLSFSVLRSVSPIHVEYLQNMGVSASMSISLIREGKLWGLIACHHQTSKYISYETRTICEFIGRITSLELASHEENQDLDYKIKLQSIQAHFVESIAQGKDLIEGLVSDQRNLLDLAGASGAVLLLGDRTILIGQTPPEEAIPALIDWVESKIERELIFYTNSLAKDYLAAENYKNVASGLLALVISRIHQNYLLWFRPEVIQTVNWGGNPNKPVEIADDGSLRLTPRKSFELWQQTVHFQSFPWKSCEINAAIELRNNIIGIVLRKADQLAKINRELERSNEELDSFAYIASHDLKEPLRGIHNYSNFLIEDYGEVLTEDGVGKLQTIARLTQRMEDLIQSLLHYSRLGRAELFWQKTDLNELLQNTIDTANMSLRDKSVEIRIPHPLPTVKCDRTQISEVFNNLIINAIKYNDKPKKEIEVGWYEEDLLNRRDNNEEENRFYTFYIRDNGIGIRPNHLEMIFRIFKRLHPPKKFGGGTGAGLTIAKKIVERHGGKIWVESTYGQGSTFYFSLKDLD